MPVGFINRTDRCCITCSISLSAAMRRVRRGPAGRHRRAAYARHASRSRAAASAVLPRMRCAACRAAARGRALRPLPCRAAGLRLGPRGRALPLGAGTIRGRAVRARSRRCCAATSTASISRWAARWPNSSTPPPRLTPATIDLVIPVPLHRARLRWRGFNQAALLGAALARRLDCPLDARSSGACARRRRKPRATAPSARATSATLSPCAAPRASPGRRVLLVDDVMTTGATADECARVLLAAGARRIDVLTLARAL